MSPREAIWLRVAAGTVVAAALLLALAPARPGSRLSPVASVPAGALVGALLYSLISRRRPQLPLRQGSLPLLIAKLALFGLLAANEEIVWRRIVLGELLASGELAALVASTLGFALVHRRRQGLHLGTGAAFGGLYLGSGALAASVAAHWTYNVLVWARLDRSRLRATLAS